MDVAIAQDLTVLEWMSGDGMVGNFKAITIAVPRIKIRVRQQGRCGSRHRRVANSPKDKRPSGFISPAVLRLGGLMKFYLVRIKPGVTHGRETNTTGRRAGVR